MPFNIYIKPMWFISMCVCVKFRINILSCHLSRSPLVLWAEVDDGVSVFIAVSNLAQQASLYSACQLGHSRNKDGDGLSADS